MTYRQRMSLTLRIHAYLLSAKQYGTLTWPMRNAQLAFIRATIDSLLKH